MNKASVFNLLKLISAFLIAILILGLIRHFAFDSKNIYVPFTLGFLLIVGFIAGKTFSIFGLPELSGFLFVGMLCGPSGFSILGAHEIKALAPINQLALALIAVQAGSEISMEFLKKGTKSISMVILFQSAIILIGMSGIFLLCIYVFGFSIANSNQASIASAIIFATLSISKAPADTLAILGETRLKGSFANHTLGVVVLIDILVIILFQIVLLFVKPTIVEGAFFDVGKIITLAE
jgi:Kef-type K+ transport system membrane component KefB